MVRIDSPVSYLAARQTADSINFKAKHNGEQGEPVARRCKDRDRENSSYCRYLSVENSKNNDLRAGFALKPMSILTLLAVPLPWPIEKGETGPDQAAAQP
jgi:hypothetical protein